MCGILETFLKEQILVTTRSKRWNGNIEALPEEYVQNVIAKMVDYGDRVQFSLAGNGTQPSYRVMNAMDKTMAFDRNHHLVQPDEEEFADANTTPLLTLEQLRAMLAGRHAGAAGKARKVRVVRAPGTTRASAAKLNEQFAMQRYEYFRNHRNALPPSISEHSNEITELMKKGIPVEQAFDEVVKKYF